METYLESKWRVEPQRALNHFLKETAGESFFSGEGSTLFDYFQDDEFVELRTLLDEPIGRSHFLAHVERFAPDGLDLVRLWLLLHQYHMESTEEKRFDGAKNVYKHYFLISQETKRKAEAFRERARQSHQNSAGTDPGGAGDKDGGAENGEAPGEGEAEAGEDAKAHPASTETVSLHQIDGDELQTTNTADSEMVQYYKMLTPAKCHSFPYRVIALILHLRPIVEQELYEAGLRFKSSLPPNGSGSPQLSGGTPTVRTTRKYSSSIEAFVDLQIGEREQMSTLHTVSSGVTDAAGSCPGGRLFVELQNEVFKEMKPLYHHFRTTSEDYEAYRKSKRSLYNHVEPKDFRYIRILGKGGFGQVVHVVRESTGKHYAMKVQAKDTLVNTWGGKMQHVEIERDVLVAHQTFPFIVSLRYAFQNDTHAFLCLDLAENGSLRDLLEGSPGFQLEVPQLRLYAAEIVLALECLHDHEIIYRDLKPENVLLCADGHIMLADMGLAGFYYQDKYNDEDRCLVENGRHRHSMEMSEEDIELFGEESKELADGDTDLDEDEGEEDGGTESASSSGSTPARAAGAPPEVDTTGLGVDAKQEEDQDEGEAETPGTADAAPKRVKTIRSHDTDCGTPLYRPPEMVTHEHYNEGVDWFMLGVFTYECLMGRLPFQPKNDGISDSGMIEIDTDEQELRLLRRKVVIPSHLDKNTASFLEGLLDTDPSTRLGVGPAEQGRDFESLKSHGFFVPLAGPLATSLDWDKVLNKAFPPVFVPPAQELEEKAQFSSFDALVRAWKKTAKKEAREYARRRKQKADYENVKVLTEGKPLEKSLERYFDNWDYIDPESINQEKEAARREAGDGPLRSRSIRKEVSKSFHHIKSRLHLHK